MEELKAKKNQLYEQLKLSRKKVDMARDLLHQYEEKYHVLKNEFEQVDQKLAMLDGRYKKLPPAGTRRQAIEVDSAQLVMNLTKDQLLRIAGELGVEVEESSDELE